MGRATSDAMMVVNRPSEETGHPLENAFDDNPATWFRTTRSPAVQGGPHEWVIGFTERRLIDGIELAPRNDQHWKHGQIRDYEIYMGDNNGDWGTPVKRGQLKLQEGVQAISFRHRRPPAALPRPEHAEPRRRWRSGHRPDGDGGGASAARAFNAAVASEVAPITLSTFHVWLTSRRKAPNCSSICPTWPCPRASAATSLPGKEMRMNGLWFRKAWASAPTAASTCNWPATGICCAPTSASTTAAATPAACSSRSGAANACCTTVA
jgi:hypothetical protein